MAVNRRFIVKNGLDNSNQTITNVASPVNSTDAATRGFSSDAANITVGTLAAARLPAFTGDATSVAGTSSLTLANSGAAAGSYTNPNITVDSKGRVTSISSGTGATGLTAGSGSTGFINYSGVTASAGQWNGGSSIPTGTTRLNYVGDLYANEFFSSTEYSVINDISGTVHARNASNSAYSYLTMAGSTVGIATERTVGQPAVELMKFNGTSVTVAGSLTVNGSFSASSYSGLVTSFNSRTGAVSLSSSDVTGALGYTPYNSTNPSGYTSNVGTVTSVGVGPGMNFVGFSTSGTITMGTPSTCTLSTANSASGTTHTHTISIPDASGSTSGLLSGGDQSVNGVKIFASSYTFMRTGTSKCNLYIGSSDGFLYGDTSTIGFHHDANAKGFQFNVSTGNATLSGTLTQNSDRNIKTDISPVTGALSSVIQLGGYTYRRDGVEAREMGVIAQEVEAVAPELVTVGEDGKRSVAYGNMAALFIESIKELKAEIDQLKAEIKRLST